MRAKSLRSVLDNYPVLQELGEIVLDGNVNPDVRARVIGVQVKMESFEFFFWHKCWQDNLSAALQSSTISAAEGQHLASLTVSTIAKIRMDQCFSLFWDSVKKKGS